MKEVKALEAQLHAEGFLHTYVWQDGPGVSYPDHVHPTETAHIVLAGEMRLTMAGQTTTCHPGDRLDVPAGAVHSARMGFEGCRYLIGER
jgi:mannose-6-phosphate isomerase-like protein (cupin superfamily)